MYICAAWQATGSNALTAARRLARKASTASWTPMIREPADEEQYCFRLQVPQRLDEADGEHEDKQGGGREEQPPLEVGLVGWPGARGRARNAQEQRELP